MIVISGHDTYTLYGGAERDFEGMHQLYPNCPVYTLVVDKKLKANISNWDVKVSPLQKIYNHYRNLQHLFAFVPFAIMLFILEKADL